LASDLTSVLNFGERTLSYAGVGANGNDADNTAEWQVYQYSNQRSRISSLTVKPQADPANLWPLVLDVDLRDAVLVKTDPPGSGTALSQLVTVEGITHDISLEMWETVYECQPLADHETDDYWILGTSELGDDTRIA
jgi:hypothetical protein